MRDAHLREEELLGPATAAREEHLRACASCSRRMADQDRVRTAIGDLEREAPPPAAALALLEGAADRRSTRAWRPLLAAALVVAMAVVAASAWKLGRTAAPLPAPVVDELALDHLHYEHRTDAAAIKGDQGLIASWFAGRLGFTPHLGALEAVTLEGAKPCRIAGKWTALVWLERAGHWLSLFTMPEQVARGRGCASAEGVRVCASPDPRGGARVLVGDLPEAEMMRLVEESLQ